MHPIVLFVIIFFSIIFVIAAFVFTYQLAKSRTKNNINNAIVLVRNGDEIISYKGKLASNPSKRGYHYIYNKKHTFVPESYTKIFYKNRLMIFVDSLNSLIASPFYRVEELSEQERGELIYELIESHIGADSIKAIKGKPTINIIIIAVIAFIVGIAGMFGFNYVQDMMESQKAQKSQTTQQNTTDNVTYINDDSVRIEKGGN